MLIRQTGRGPLRAEHFAIGRADEPQKQYEV